MTSPLPKLQLNDTPLFCLNAPDSFGLSYNEYEQFAVDTRGAILYTPQPYANPFSLVITDTSPLSTYIQGDLTVLGNPTAVTVINPQGITFQDCQLSNNSGSIVLQGNSITLKDSTLHASDQLQLTATQLYNQGRLSSNKLHIDTQHLHNGTAYSQEIPPLHTQNTLIQANESLHISTQTLHNFPGSRIQSDGDLHISGAFSPDSSVTGLTQQVLNHSATITAKGTLIIQSHTLHNKNVYFLTELRCIQEENRIEYQPEGESTRYPKADVRWAYDAPDYYSLYLPKENNRKVRYFTTYDYTWSQAETIVTESYPARLQAGQAMQLTGHVINDKSEITAGGTLCEITGLPYRLETQGAIGQRLSREKGNKHGTSLEWWNWWHDLWEMDKRRCYTPNTPYERTITQDFALPITASQHPRAIEGISNDPLQSFLAANTQAHSLPASHWLPSLG
jgi:filamentous hemagglutinin family protein